jgi:hypothetical protein
MMKKLSALFLALILTLSLSACGDQAGEIAGALAEVAIEQALNYAEETLREGGAESGLQTSEALSPETLSEEGCYTERDDLALYIHTYAHLPDNFITKKEARALGWEGGSLEPVAPGMCIGGDYFGNYEGLLPEDRDYTECDIDTLEKDSRGAKRIVFSDDGLIYYTEDHYESFELLYGEP